MHSIVILPRYLLRITDGLPRTTNVQNMHMKTLPDDQKGDESRLSSSLRFPSTLSSLLGSILLMSSSTSSSAPRPIPRRGPCTFTYQGRRTRIVRKDFAQHFRMENEDNKWLLPSFCAAHIPQVCGARGLSKRSSRACEALQGRGV